MTGRQRPRAGQCPPGGPDLPESHGDPTRWVLSPSPFHRRQPEAPDGGVGGLQGRGAHTPIPQSPVLPTAQCGFAPTGVAHGLGPGAVPPPPAQSPSRCRGPAWPRAPSPHLADECPAVSQAEGMAGAFRGRLEAEAGGPWQVGAIPLVRQLGAGTESHPQRHHLFRPELLSLGTWGGPKVCMRRGCLSTFLGTFLGGSGL